MHSSTVINAQDMELVSALLSMRTSSIRSLRNPPTQKQRPAKPPPASTTPTVASSTTTSSTSPSDSSFTSHVQPLTPVQLHPATFIPAAAIFPYAIPLANITNRVKDQVVTRYDPEQRQQALKRYRLKKMRRISKSKVIRYQVRKRLADARPRHRGRFFKPAATAKVEN